MALLFTLLVVVALAVPWAAYRASARGYRDHYVATPPRPGDYGVTRTGGFVGWVIRIVTRSDYNHAFVVLDSERIVEAIPKGARVGRLREYPHARFNEHTDTLTETQRLRIVIEANDLVGLGYNFLDIVALGLAALGLHLRFIDNRVGRQDKLICSQLVDLAYYRSGVALFHDGRRPQEIRPADLASRLVPEDRG